MFLRPATAIESYLDTYGAKVHTPQYALTPSTRSPRDCLALWSERIDYGVHSSPRAFDGAVRNVLRRNRRVSRHVSCGANGPSRNAGGANGECENH